ncbi:MAG TPA: helix-turn-helix domain-containing protein [Thermoanaerobaculia bacterium]|nr:helix-turn-helix domain-containing protein [Thermoanaerobaculia bacterium]
MNRTVQDWEDAALAAIAKEGLASLAIPKLARSLNVTKGSFYWHFTSLQELVEKSLRRWEERDQITLDELREIADPRRRLATLFEQAMEQREAHGLYIALASSAAPQAARIIRRISNRRLRFLIESYAEAGLKPADARARALLAYTAYIGALHLRLSKKQEIDSYVAHALKTLIPAGPRGTSRVD